MNESKADRQGLPLFPWPRRLIIVPPIRWSKRERVFKKVFLKGEFGMGERKLVVIMVGLPARGKTFLSLRLKRYLEWQGYGVMIFNAGRYRRDILGMGSSRSEFFDPLVKRFAKERERIAERCFGDLTEWLRAGGDVGIYDATNVTRARREYLRGESVANGFDHLFVENICDSPEVIEEIIKIKITRSVDYRDKDMEAAKRDFLERMRHYESVYEPVDEDFPHIKVFNFGEKVTRRFDPRHILFDEMADFLGGINLAKKEVYITRHGETFFNLEDRIGGDSALTESGVEYARELSRFFHGMDLVVFTSRKKRTVETGRFFDCERVELEELNEIDSGICDSMTYEEIKLKHPEIHRSRSLDKFNFRYPRGESYRDLIQRVKKAVVRIESQRRDVLVIAHRAVNRCLFSYFIPTPSRDIPYIEMPLNRIVRVYHRGALYDHEVSSVEGGGRGAGGQPTR